MKQEYGHTLTVNVCVCVCVWGSPGDSELDEVQQVLAAMTDGARLVPVSVTEGAPGGDTQLNIVKPTLWSLDVAILFLWSQKCP